MIRDKIRMVDVAWTQLAEMTTDSERVTREAMADSTAYVLFSEEACGRQLPALLVPSPESEKIVVAHEVAAKAGLGGLSAQSQHQIFDTAVVELRARMSELGIDLPEPTEHRL
ncbi:MAG: hypothetical protein GXP35_03750 [Actinobacteria bacterium]|nr:hypothetical protein [Actinomycetota bacterium]